MDSRQIYPHLPSKEFRKSDLTGRLPNVRKGPITVVRFFRYAERKHMINVAPLARSKQLILNGRAVWRDLVRCEVDKLCFHLRGCRRAFLRQKSAVV
jgi:hypothetical protein